jgi:hypothetical protein
VKGRHAWSKEIRDYGFIGKIHRDFRARGLWISRWDRLKARLFREIGTSCFKSWYGTEVL